MPIERLPSRLRNSARRSRDFLLSDSPALVILGLGILSRGLSYSPHVLGPAPRAGGHPAEAALPMSVWSAIWVAVGVLCLVAAVWSRRLIAAWAIGLGVGLNMLWAGSFVAVSITGDMARGWVTGIGYASVALLVIWAIWRGSRAEVIIPKGAVASELRRGDG